MHQFTTAAREEIWFQGVRITNIQTLDVKHRKRSEVRGNQLNPNRMFEYHIEERFRCFILRLGVPLAYAVFHHHLPHHLLYNHKS